MLKDYIRGNGDGNFLSRYQCFLPQTTHPPPPPNSNTPITLFVTEFLQVASSWNSFNHSFILSKRHNFRSKCVDSQRIWIIKPLQRYIKAFVTRVDLLKLSSLSGFSKTEMHMGCSMIIISFELVNDPVGSFCSSNIYGQLRLKTHRYSLKNDGYVTLSIPYFQIVNNSFAIIVLQN